MHCELRRVLLLGLANDLHIGLTMKLLFTIAWKQPTRLDPIFSLSVLQEDKSYARVYFRQAT
jgi:hypothetical protein